MTERLIEKIERLRKLDADRTQGHWGVLYQCVMPPKPVAIMDRNQAKGGDGYIALLEKTRGADAEFLASASEMMAVIAELTNRLVRARAAIADMPNWSKQWLSTQLVGDATDLTKPFP